MVYIGEIFLEYIEGPQTVKVYLLELRKFRKVKGYGRFHQVLVGTGIGDIDPVGIPQQGTRTGILLKGSIHGSNKITLDLMMDAKLDITYASHVMIVLQLLIYLWRNNFGKEADLLITIPVGCSFWWLEHHESLIIYFFLLLLNTGTILDL